MQSCADEEPAGRARLNPGDQPVRQVRASTTSSSWHSLRLPGTGGAGRIDTARSSAETRLTADSSNQTRAGHAPDRLDARRCSVVATVSVAALALLALARGLERRCGRRRGHRRGRPGRNGIGEDARQLREDGGCLRAAERTLRCGATTSARSCWAAKSSEAAHTVRDAVSTRAISFRRTPLASAFKAGMLGRRRSRPAARRLRHPQRPGASSDDQLTESIQVRPEPGRARRTRCRWRHDWRPSDRAAGQGRGHGDDQDDQEERGDPHRSPRPRPGQSRTCHQRHRRRPAPSRHGCRERPRAVLLLGLGLQCPREAGFPGGGQAAEQPALTRWRPGASRVPSTSSRRATQAIDRAGTGRRPVVGGAGPTPSRRTAPGTPRRPMRASSRTRPRLYTTLGGPTPAPRTCSGLRKAGGCPMMRSVAVRASAPRSCAMPKSASRA